MGRRFSLSKDSSDLHLSRLRQHRLDQTRVGSCSFRRSNCRRASYSHRRRGQEGRRQCSEVRDEAIEGDGGGRFGGEGRQADDFDGCLGQEGSSRLRVLLCIRAVSFLERQGGRERLETAEVCGRAFARGPLSGPHATTNIVLGCRWYFSFDLSPCSVNNVSKRRAGGEEDIQ